MPFLCRLGLHNREWKPADRLTQDATCPRCQREKRVVL